MRLSDVFNFVKSKEYEIYLRDESIDSTEICNSSLIGTYGRYFANEILDTDSRELMILQTAELLKYYNHNVCEIINNEQSKIGIVISELPFF